MEPLVAYTHAATVNLGIASESAVDIACKRLGLSAQECLALKELSSGDVAGFLKAVAAGGAAYACNAYAPGSGAFCGALATKIAGAIVDPRSICGEASACVTKVFLLDKFDDAAEIETLRAEGHAVVPGGMLAPRTYFACLCKDGKFPDAPGTKQGVFKPPTKYPPGTVAVFDSSINKYRIIAPV